VGSPGNIAQNQRSALSSLGALNLQPVLPDGIFSDQKCLFWNIFDGLWMENVGVPTSLSFDIVIANLYIFYDNLVCLWPFWYIFPNFCFFAPRKILPTTKEVRFFYLFQAP
jgi:hypothetical protein